MKKCFWKPLALVHKLEHSLTATTFYKKKLIPVHSGVIPVHSGVIPVHSGPFRCHSGSFRPIPVHSGVIPVHSGPFRSIPPHSGSFLSVSVFSNAHTSPKSRLQILQFRVRLLDLPKFFRPRREPFWREGFSSQSCLLSRKSGKLFATLPSFAKKSIPT